VNPYLIGELLDGPVIIKSLIRQITGPKLDQPTEPGRFSPREVVAHLADWEPVFLERMQSAVGGSCPSVQVYDEADWAIEHGYGKSDVLAQADLFRDRRQDTIDFLKTLTPEQWKLTFNHPERGELSIEDQGNMLLGHDLYHIRQLMEVLEEKVAGTW